MSLKERDQETLVVGQVPVGNAELCNNDQGELSWKLLVVADHRFAPNLRSCPATPRQHLYCTG